LSIKARWVLANILVVIPLLAFAIWSANGPHYMLMDSSLFNPALHFGQACHVDLAYTLCEKEFEWAPWFFLDAVIAVIACVVHLSWLRDKRIKQQDSQPVERFRSPLVSVYAEHGIYRLTCSECGKLPGKFDSLPTAGARSAHLRTHPAV